MAWYCAVAAAAGAAGMSAYHIVYGTMLRHAPLWESKELDLETKCGYYLSWHLVSVHSVAQAVMFALPLFKPALGPALRLGMIANSLTMLVSSDIAIAHAVVHRKPKLMLPIWIGLAAIGIFGLIGSSTFKQ